MKKRPVFLIFSILLFCLFTACSSSGVQALPAVSPEISGTAHIVCDSGEWEISVSRTALGSLSCEGELISYYWTGGQFYESCEGLQGDPGSCRLLSNSYAVQLQEVLDIIFTETLSPVASDQLQGTWRMAPFTVTVEKSTGKLLQIVSEECNFRVDFS